MTPAQLMKIKTGDTLLILNHVTKTTSELEEVTVSKIQYGDNMRVSRIEVTKPGREHPHFIFAADGNAHGAKRIVASISKIKELQ